MCDTGMVAKKRAPGEGSIHLRRDGRWEASRTVGRTAGGNPRRIRAYGRTKSQALNKLERAIVELGGVAGAGPIPDAGGLTVRGLLDRYLAAKAGVTKLRETTLASYRWYVNQYILPSIGTLPLRRLRPSHVQDLLAELGRRQVEDRRKPKPGVELEPRPPRCLSPRVQRYVWALLNGACRHALRLQLIRANPCDQVEPPRGGRVRQPEAWTPGEVELLLAAAATTALHALYYLAITTGLRRGELLGLQWDDVDLVGGALQIRRSRDAGGLVTAPKTRAGSRRVPLSADAVAVLVRHQAAQAKQCETATEAGRWRGGPEAWVFTTSTGLPVAARNVLHQLERICRGAGVRRLPFHCLRHTAATLALRSGVPARDLADRLGHTDPGLTLRVYPRPRGHRPGGRAAAPGAAPWAPAGRGRHRGRGDLMSLCRQHAANTYAGVVSPGVSAFVCGTPDWVRTSDLQIRSPRLAVAGRLASS